MPYFYKDEFVDYEPSDGIYIHKSEGKMFYICIDGEIGDYSIDGDFISHEGLCDETQMPYFGMLRPFLNEHIDGIRNFDRDTLDIIVRSIERTYKIYLEFCDHLSNELRGGSNTKSAK